MPGSSESGKAEGIGLLKSHLPTVLSSVHSVLDVGCGWGAWHNWLAPHMLPGVPGDAIEIWEPYVAHYDLRTRYDRVFVADASTINLSLLRPHYDLACFGDIVEHMESPEAGVALVKRFSWTTALISLPMAGGGNEHQGAFGGNPYETHRSSWSVESMYAAFDVKSHWADADMGVFVL